MRTLKVNRQAFNRPLSPKKRVLISYRSPEERIKPTPRLNLNEYIDHHNQKRQFKAPPMPTQISNVISDSLKRKSEKRRLSHLSGINLISDDIAHVAKSLNPVVAVK